MIDDGVHIGTHVLLPEEVNTAIQRAANQLGLGGRSAFIRMLVCAYMDNPEPVNLVTTAKQLKIYERRNQELMNRDRCRLGRS